MVVLMDVNVKVDLKVVRWDIELVALMEKLKVDLMVVVMVLKRGAIWAV